MDRIKFEESIIVKFLSGTATAEESESLIKYMEEAKENRLHYFRLKRIWQESHMNSNETRLTENSWERLKLRMEELTDDKGPVRRPGFFFILKRIAVAASITILIGTSVYLGYQKYTASQLPAKELQVEAPPGSRSFIVLPDGSTVWLNSSSKLTYNYDFEKTGREVSLVGEAFFDIKHHGNSSFIVTTSNLKIRVLGTQFNVKSYPDEQVIETTLVKGKIEVNRIGDEKAAPPITMTPNQKMIFRKPGGIAESAPATDKTEPVAIAKQPDIRIVKKVNPEEESSWKDGKLIVKREPLEDLARKLERYYNVSISFENDLIKQFVFTGTLDEVTIEQVLLALESASPIRCSLDRDHIIMSLTNN